MPNPFTGGPDDGISLHGTERVVSEEEDLKSRHLFYGRFDIMMEERRRKDREELENLRSQRREEIKQEAMDAADMAAVEEVADRWLFKVYEAPKSFE